MSERERFEAWMTAPPYEKRIDRFAESFDFAAWPGQYRDYEVQLAWEAWEEALGLVQYRDPKAP